MIYKVEITETCQKIVEVEAENSREALKIANLKYRDADSDFVLTGDDFIDSNITIYEG